MAVDGSAVTFGTARRGLGAGASPSPLIVVPNVTALPSTNVTALPSTASVPTSYYLMWHYNCLWKTVNSQPRLIAIRCLNE